MEGHGETSTASLPPENNHNNSQEFFDDVFLDAHEGYEFDSADADWTVAKTEDEVNATPRAPLWVWPMLVLSVCAVSSAATVFKTFNDEVPPVLLASWRLQVTSYVLLLGCIFQYVKLPADLRRRLWSCVPPDSYSKCTPLWGVVHNPVVIMLASGFCLALHFGAWVWGIGHTSLPHSLLLISATPVLIAIGMLLLCKPISKGELAGTVLGALGVCLLVAGTKVSSDSEVTLAGDAASLLGSFAIIGYLTAGMHLRSWVPTFVYVVPVTFSAALLQTLYALLFEINSFESKQALVVGNSGGFGSDLGVIFGWLRPEYRWRVLYLGVVPGVLGHTNFNMLLRYISPLVITISLNFEPLLGSLLGWALKLSSLPSGPFTWGGSVLLLAATMLVSYSAARREATSSAITDATDMATVNINSNRNIELAPSSKYVKLVGANINPHTYSSPLEEANL